MKIYCLINRGAGLSDEISDLLLETAHDMMDAKDRKRRISLPSEKLKGEVTTRFEVGFMGQVTGIIFSANFDWENGSTKTSYLVRPLKNRDELLGGRWVNMPLFPTSPVPARG